MWVPPDIAKQIPYVNAFPYIYAETARQKSCFPETKETPSRFV